MICPGYRVLFRSCELLVHKLLVAERELRLPQMLKQLAWYDALIIDDIGYIQQSRKEIENNKSVIIIVARKKS